MTWWVWVVVVAGSVAFLATWPLAGIAAARLWEGLVQPARKGTDPKRLFEDKRGLFWFGWAGLFYVGVTGIAVGIILTLLTVGDFIVSYVKWAKEVAYGTAEKK